MNLDKQTKFFLAIGLQLVIIFVLIIFKVSVLIGGTDVILKIAPVDPRDPLRGDYATFRYDISTIPYYTYYESFKQGDEVYVTLYQRGIGADQIWVANRASKTKPQDANTVFIKGTVTSSGNDQSTRRDLQITYGIEEFFIPEGTGQNFNFWDKESTARVAIDNKGNAVLKQIYVDGEKWP